MHNAKLSKNPQRCMHMVLIPRLHKVTRSARSASCWLPGTRSCRMKYESIEDKSSNGAQSGRRSLCFWLMVGVAECLLLLVLLLLIFYCEYFHDGFAWDAGKPYHTMFNVHPLCMVLGFVFFYSQGSVIFRVALLCSWLASLPRLCG